MMTLGGNSQSPFEFLERAAVNWPDKPFFSDGINALSFAQAYREVNRISTALKALGVRPGQTVALELPLGLQLLFIEACFSLAAVSCRLPDSAQNPGFKVDWCFSYRKTSDPRANKTCFVDSKFLRKMSQYSDEPNVNVYDSDQSTCRIIFSSGTTGDPKPISFSVAMVRARAEVAHEISIQDSPYMSLLDISTAIGFHTFYASVMFGDTYLIPDSAQHNISQIHKNKVTSIVASPIQISYLMKEILLTGKSIPSLEKIYSAGTVLPIAIRRMARKLTNADLFNLYGSSEAGRAAEHSINETGNVNFAGYPANGTTLQIVDENDVELARNEIGLIRYKRNHQAHEYIGNPAATSKAFRGGWFYTGDTGFLDEVNGLTLTGRTNELINLGGVKVDPVRIEAFAIGLAGITDAAVFPFEKPNGLIGIGIAIVSEDNFSWGLAQNQLQKEFGNSSPEKLLLLPEIPRNQMGKPIREKINVL
jgi:acyl-coenzyme A synthetase/AMP-(fatty) acid ligase